MMHSGAPWRDLQEYYDLWQTVYNRFSQRQKDEKLRQLFENVRENPDMQSVYRLLNAFSDSIFHHPAQSSGEIRKDIRETRREYTRVPDFSVFYESRHAAPSAGYRHGVCPL